MTTYEPLDRSLAAIFAEEAAVPAPVDLADRIVAATAGLRPRPGWRARLRQESWGQQSGTMATLTGRPSSRAWLVVALVLILAAAVAVVGALLRDREPVLRGVFEPAGSLSVSTTIGFLRPDGQVLFVDSPSAGLGVGTARGNTREEILLHDLATGVSREVGQTMIGVRYAIPLADGRVLVIGLAEGAIGGFGGPSHADLVDPDAGTVTRLGPTVGHHLFGAGVRLADGRVLLVGEADRTTEAELFDPISRTFTATGPTNRPMMQPTATLLADGRVLVIGDHEPVAEIYDPSTGTFSQTGTMSGPREGFTATLLQDGRVLIAGGWATNGTVVDGTFVASEPERLGSTVEIFDPSTGRFTQVGSMVTPRVYHFAAALSDGRVLIGGGLDQGHVDVLGAELFDPSAGTSSASGDLSMPRSNAGALLLTNGHVLVIGSVPQFGAKSPAEQLAAMSLEVFE